MANLDILNLKGDKVEKIKISDGIVKQEISTDALHQEVRRYLASIRTGCHSTKDRSEVRGGGKKPWRQKGTGNARAGTNRSPIWRGGGVVFGPKPRSYSFKLNKKVIRKSKSMALSEKFKDNKILVLDALDFKNPKTKKAIDILNKFKLKNKRVLVVLEGLNGNEAKSFSNIANVILASAGSLSTYSILVSEYVIFTRDSLNKFIRRSNSGGS
jgi:large subunit ribosomal protein L4